MDVADACYLYKALIITVLVHYLLVLPFCVYVCMWGSV